MVLIFFSFINQMNMHMKVLEHKHISQGEATWVGDRICSLNFDLYIVMFLFQNIEDTNILRAPLVSILVGPLE